MTVKLWTIQDESGWNELQTKKTLIPKKEFVDPDFKSAYDWLKIQMYDKIGKPNNLDQYPVWAWHQYFDANKRKPDLRSSGHLPSGKTGYRIEFEKEKKEVLISDFVLWHYVLNKCYLPSDIEDYDFFENTSEKIIKNLAYENYPKHIIAKIENSWKKIFDMDFQSEDISSAFKEKKIQANVWQLNLNEVINVDKFTAR